MTNYNYYKDSQPCDHPGCINHKTHPCEKCGRINCEGEVKVPKWEIE